MKRLLVLVLALGLLSATLVTSSPKASAASNSLLDPGLVQTNKGWIQGLVNPLTGEREFLSIPYAAPPVGNLRWKAPQPAASWGGVRWTTSYSSACVQPGILNIAGSTILGVNNVFNGSIGSEDCLYLNVFTPSILAGSNLPVMVWIPGGAFEFGAGSYDPSALVEQSNEIVVTINYRLGSFGFLALPGLSAEASNGSTGDYGLQDQQAALRWVQANIANFGGNAHNVTIFGESAGGSSVCDQIASPLAAGLFQKAITESGPCEGESDFSVNPLTTAEQNGTRFAASFGCTGSASAVVACMRSVSASSLVVFSSFSASDLQENTDTLPFAPTIDGSVLPTSVVAALHAGTYNHVPVLEGTNLNEAALFVFAQFLASGAMTSAQYTATLQHIFGSNAAAVQAQYPVTSSTSPDQALSDALTDFIWACPARTADGFLAQSVPTYAYEFSDPDPLGIEPLTQGLIGLDFTLSDMHGSEVFYVFDGILNATGGLLPQLAGINPLPYPFSALTVVHPLLAAQMIGYWTNFARNGNPNGSGLPNWPQYSASSDQFQALTSFFSGGPQPISTFASEHQCGFWSTLGI